MSRTPDQGPASESQDSRTFGDRNPFRGGLTGIALVALATLAVAVAGAVITGLALLIAG